ncbi:MAG: SAM-dependent methyltransferase, partial [Negativicoccus succinicivorans]|nr:SAM-dependent methyltransferase [Negativicoccus succinicivorans]
MKGTLYLVPTPIGNLQDMTYRAVATLRDVALIACEDTRHTRLLCSHYEITTPLFSYHEHNKDTAGPKLIERLLAGEDIAQVSD